MTNKSYTKDHEWIAMEGNVATIGISDYAQQQLGDIVFIELPEIGQTVTKGEEAAVVESVKAASEVYAPVTGKVVDVNTALQDNPEKVNQSPEDGGWFMKVEIEGDMPAGELMDEATYREYVENL